MNNYKTVFFAIGVLLIILGTFMIIPLFLQITYGEENKSFLSSTTITIFMGILLVLTNLEENRKLNLQNAFLLTALSWLSVAIFGCIPFFLSDLNLSIVDSFFESMSGITTTGATIITNLDDTPKSILAWRAILQWLGGIGIIVMAITMLPLLNIGGMQLFRVEGSETAEKILPKTREITLVISIIYIALTFFCGIAYWLVGMNIFDSIAHSMTTIATGGFSNYNESIGYFDNNLIEITAMIFIFLGSIPFIAYIKFLNGDRKVFINDSQIRTFFKILIFSILILLIFLAFKSKNIFEISFISVCFNIVSILTGTGYVTEDFSNWGNFPLIFFLILMFIGGCAGSTTCGIKIFRVQILYQFILNQLKKIIYPRGVFVIKYDKSNIDDKFMASVISFIYLYIVIFFVISLLLSLSGLDFLTSISGAATSISNVGPGLGEIIGPNGNFSQLSDLSKWVLSLGMILGRLELFAILVLFIPSFWRKY